jgi:hypothetical protein
MRARVPIAAVSLGSLIVAAACQAQSYHPAELGNCTTTDPKFPCEGEVFGAAVFPDGGGRVEGGLPPGDTQCLAGGNILYLNGDPADPVSPGTLTITGAQAAFTPKLKQDPNGAVFGVEIDVTSTVEGGSACVATFFQSVSPPNGQPFPALMTGDYPNTHGIAAQGQPEMDIDDCNGSMCLSGVGAFHVYDITTAQSDAGADAGVMLQSFTASFIQWCSGNSNPGAPALRGCIHFGP